MPTPTSCGPTGFPPRLSGHPTEAGAPAWAARIFNDLRAANDGKLSGSFDVFAWREPSEIRFVEAKVGADRIRPSQRSFVETALRFHHIEQFTIIAIPR
ncbi:MAG: hypothetical protein QOJ73_344 [Streptosporangiaceae bacterium]|jgi:hypothetical protein|nr:hypothetical protein [Streptosporangiaceae bacterium]